MRPRRGGSHERLPADGICAVAAPSLLGCLVGVAHAESDRTRAPIVAGVGLTVPLVNHALYDAGVVAQGASIFR